MEGWSRVDHLRHPIISRQERRHSPRETLGPTVPFQGPEKCPTLRMPDAGWKSARLSEHLQRTRNNPTYQGCFLTPIQTRRVNTALHLKNSSTVIKRYFQIVINRKVVASYSRDTHPFRHRNGDTLSEEHWDQQHPSRPRELPDATDAGYRYDPPASLSTSNEREALQTQQGCSHIPIQTRCGNTELHFETPRQESDRYLQIVKNWKGGRELFTWDTHPVRDKNSDTLPGKLWDKPPVQGPESCPTPRMTDIVKDPPASQSTSTSAKLFKAASSYRSRHTVSAQRFNWKLLDRNQIGTFKLLNSKGGREMFTRAVPSQRLLLARSQSASTSQLLLKHSNCLHPAAKQLDDRVWARSQSPSTSQLLLNTATACTVPPTNLTTPFQKYTAAKELDDRV